MTPGVPSQNIPDSVRADTELPCESNRVVFTSGITTADFKDLRLREFCAGCAASEWTTPLNLAIPHVFGMGSQEEMIDSHTSRGIALVQYVKIVRNGAPLYLPRDSVGEFPSLALHLEGTIPTILYSRRPQPAFFRAIHLLIETLFDWATTVVSFTGLGAQAGSPFRAWGENLAALDTGARIEDNLTSHGEPLFRCATAPAGDTARGKLFGISSSPKRVVPVEIEGPAFDLADLLPGV